MCYRERAVKIGGSEKVCMVVTTRARTFTVKAISWVEEKDTIIREEELKGKKMQVFEKTLCKC